MTHERNRGLDRREELRSDDPFIPDTRVVAIHHRRGLVGDHRAVFLPPGGEQGDPSLVFLGERDGIRYAARAVEAAEVDDLERATRGRFLGLRAVAHHLPAWEAALLFYAAGILAWHRTARHCGVCGAVTASLRAGHQRRCTSESCGQVHFPRTDPAIITLVSRTDRCLLVHQPGWPDGRLSTLAGFVEPGESLEEAVVREVREEVGLDVVGTEYFASQPWPFPHTLMVGFRTEVTAGDMVLGEELTDARWFTRTELRQAVEAGEVTIPDPYALSRALIEDWLG